MAIFPALQKLTHMWNLKGVMARIDPNGWALVCEGVSSS